MTHKILDATNVHGILRVELTDNVIVVRFIFDQPKDQDQRGIKPLLTVIVIDKPPYRLL